MADLVRGKEHPTRIEGYAPFDVISGGCGINVTLIIPVLSSIAEVPYTPYLLVESSSAASQAFIIAGLQLLS